MKRICHRLACIVAMVLVCAMSLRIFASAAEINLQPRYTTVTYFYATLSIPPSGQSKIQGGVSLTNLSYTVNLTMELQQWRNASWATIKSWTTRGKDHVVIDENWSVVLGYKYRIHATATVYDQNGKVLERATKNSATVTY